MWINRSRGRPALDDTDGRDGQNEYKNQFHLLLPRSTNLHAHHRGDQKDFAAGRTRVSDALSATLRRHAEAADRKRDNASHLERAMGQTRGGGETGSSMCVRMSTDTSGTVDTTVG